MSSTTSPPITTTEVLARIEAYALRALDVPPSSSEPRSLAFTEGACFTADEVLRLVSELRTEVSR